MYRFIDPRLIMTLKNEQRSSDWPKSAHMWSTNTFQKDNNLPSVSAKVIPEHLETLFRETYKHNDKRMRFKLHHDTLKKYIELDLIPKGLRLQLSPSYGHDDPEFVTQWNNILHQCSLRILDLLVEHCSKKVNFTDTLLSELHGKLERRCNNREELNSVKTKLDSMLTKKQEKVQRMKDKKLKRDVTAKSVHSKPKKNTRPRQITKANIASNKKDEHSVTTSSRPRDVDCQPNKNLASTPMSTPIASTYSDQTKACTLDTEKMTTSCVLRISPMPLPTELMTPSPPRKIFRIVASPDTDSCVGLQSHN